MFVKVVDSFSFVSTSSRHFWLEQMHALLLFWSTIESGAEGSQECAGKFWSAVAGEGTPRALTP